MNLIKIVMLLKSKFSEFYDIKQYARHSSQQFVVRQYISHRKITIDKEK
ncbi:MAG: hypothetical protein Q8R04_03575 [Nanoarchaeota archaeon]|nr:hypothetical protein [Nanoarchaeota archaeon]